MAEKPTFKSLGITMDELDEAIIMVWGPKASGMRQLRTECPDSWIATHQHDRALRHLAVHGCPDLRTEYVLRAAGQVIDAHGFYVEGAA